MKVGNIEISYSQPTFVIAELCSNIIGHMSLTSDDFEHCIHDVARSGANAAKVQLFRHQYFPQSEWEQKKRVEFPRDTLRFFIELCHEYKLLAGASVFDKEAVQLCVDSGADFLKLATREFGNNILFSHCLDTKLPIFRSYDSSLYPTGLDNGIANDLIHLACCPVYPIINPRIPVPDYGISDEGNWGWSSHSPDWLDVCIAVSRGACVIEKHITFHADDPEYGWSLMPDDFARMMQDIRRVEQMR